MKRQGDALVLLLAGGVGSRLNVLVETRAKPAVTFGGIYRIIDFSLSNVMNSGLTKVGVLTQYKPLSLMYHIATGAAWEFTGRSRGIEILPPRTGSKDHDWYKGTADAVRRNIDFISANSSDEVVILSGDHIYHMDFYAMLEYHRAKKADVTVGMMVVPKEQIHQFGAGITNNDNRIVEWEEKPEVARTNLASMGIYVFDTQYLLNSLARNKDEIDFGMHILPWAIDNDNVFAYPFYGYWRDVGTIQAYWQANMDLLNPQSGIWPQKWGIRTNVEATKRMADRPATRYLETARVSNSLISAGCTIRGTVINSVLSPGVVVEKDAVVKDSIICRDTVIEAGATVDLTITDKLVRIGRGATVGHGEHHDITNRLYPKHLYTGITLVGEFAHIPPAMRIGRNCIIKCRAEAESFTGDFLPDGESV
ncbi:MAG: glucose-1-phosphate adenylyltransferase [Desulfofustis sp. PB-SRB1]|jgi:glucose-1-phosphate adenylyltransferase|nr:glucose-1-phosphate adenylyltransferase [Desulfofustis sp. PB-SRB1]MBM1002135.1 glucose-1-phosphate adenylyltransferase [Desulfofustis sp. PB-SRB1]HBH30025.1 glucose-1-phosphate adenylyltransferase [Desulfofustis sp.]HBH32618.1 glucose-1-phosphate adenylyltransferase [Desulfofustis sp.]